MPAATTRTPGCQSRRLREMQPDTLMDMQAEDLMDALSQLSHLQLVREAVVAENRRLQQELGTATQQLHASQELNAAKDQQLHALALGLAAASTRQQAMARRIVELEPLEQRCAQLEEQQLSDGERWAGLLHAAQATARDQNAHHNQMYSELLGSLQSLSASILCPGTTGSTAPAPTSGRQASKGSLRVRRPLGRANTVCTSVPRPRRRRRASGVKTCYL